MFFKYAQRSRYQSYVLNQTKLLEYSLGNSKYVKNITAKAEELVQHVTANT